MAGAVAGAPEHRLHVLTHQVAISGIGLEDGEIRRDYPDAVRHCINQRLQEIGGCLQFVMGQAEPLGHLVEAA